MDIRFSPGWSRQAGKARRQRGSTWAPGRQSRDSSEILPKSAPGPMLRAGSAFIDLAEGRVAAPDGTVTELRRQSADVLRLLAARAGDTVTKSETPRRGLGRHRRDRGQPGAVRRRHPPRPRRAPATRLHTAHRSRGYRLELDAAAPTPASPAPPRARGRRSPRWPRRARRLAASATGPRRRASRAPVGRGPALREPRPSRRALGPPRPRRDRGGDRRPRHQSLALRAGRRHHPPARRRDAAGGRRARSARATSSPAPLQAEDGRVRITAALADARQRAPGLGQAVGRAGGRPARAADRRRRGAGGRARRPLVRRHRPGRPRPRARGQHPGASTPTTSTCSGSSTSTA